MCVVVVEEEEDSGDRASWDDGWYGCLDAEDGAAGEAALKRLRCELEMGLKKL